MFTTGMFFSVDCQLLLTCLEHRVAPSVLHPTQRVMSMTINHLHQVFSKTYIQRSFLHWQRKSTMHISCYTTVPHLHQVLRAKDGYMWCRFLILLIESWRTVVFSGTVHWLFLKTSFHPLLWTSSGLTGSWKLSAYILALLRSPL